MRYTGKPDVPSSAYGKGRPRPTSGTIKGDKKGKRKRK